MSSTSLTVHTTYPKTEGVRLGHGLFREVPIERRPDRAAPPPRRAAGPSRRTRRCRGRRSMATGPAGRAGLLSSQRRSAVRQTVREFRREPARLEEDSASRRSWTLARSTIPSARSTADHRLGERLRPRRLLRRERVQLGLDVEAEPPPSPAASRGRARRRGSGCGRPSCGTCPGNRSAVRLPGAARPTSRSARIGEVQRVEERPGRRQPRAGRVPVCSGLRARSWCTTGTPSRVIPRSSSKHVELPSSTAPLERREGVLGQQPPGAPVPLDLDAPGRHRQPKQREEREAPHRPPRTSACLTQVGGRLRSRRGGRVPAQGRGEGCPRPRPASRPSTRTVMAGASRPPASCPCTRESAPSALHDVDPASSRDADSREAGSRCSGRMPTVTPAGAPGSRRRNRQGLARTVEGHAPPSVRDRARQEVHRRRADEPGHEHGCGLAVHVEGRPDLLGRRRRSLR